MLIQSDSSVDGSYSFPLIFEKVPEINQDGSQWTDCEIRDAINSIYQNLDKLDAYISFLVRSSMLIVQLPAAHSISISKLAFSFDFLVSSNGVLLMCLTVQHFFYFLTKNYEVLYKKYSC